MLPSLHILEHFHHPRRFPGPICSHLLYPHPQATTTCFLFLSNFLFWTFHINGIIQYVVFCIYLSLSTMFLRFISVPFYCWVASCSMNILQFVYSFNSWWVFVHKSLCECTFSFLLSRYLGVESLSHMVNLCLTFKKLLVSQGGHTILHSHKHAWDLQSHTLPNAWYW